MLKFDCTLVADGRKLPRPVNYGLVRITPPAGVEIDPKKRPFVVIDPRAGHGPGIGGFKADSEIGVALKAGHPCYFIGFLPEPMPGQTIEDILNAEATFLEQVIELHPDADGKPAVIGNCQAGWAVMMLAAARPELFGPILIAGSPLSYWAGVHGKNPMRYTGGLLGGSWLTALIRRPRQRQIRRRVARQPISRTSIPPTRFGPSNTISIPRSTARRQRYLELRGVLGRPCSPQRRGDAVHRRPALRRQQARHRPRSSPPTASRLDLRNIRSPILVFCSKGDNITPPQQALGWILDLYNSVDDIRAHGQTIVYSVHESIGHLGIFVSGSVAKKEHDEFASNIDLIDVLPPGLYEAVLTPKDPERPDRRSHRRRLSRPLRDARPRRDPRVGRQRHSRTSGASRPSHASPRSTSGSIGRSCSPGCGPSVNEASPTGCDGCIPCGCSTSCSRAAIRSCGRWLDAPSSVRQNRKPVARTTCSCRRKESGRSRSRRCSRSYGELRDHVLRGSVPRRLWIAAAAGHGGT